MLWGEPFSVLVGTLMGVRVGWPGGRGMRRGVAVACTGSPCWPVLSTLSHPHGQASEGLFSRQNTSVRGPPFCDGSGPLPG